MLMKNSFTLLLLLLPFLLYSQKATNTPNLEAATWQKGYTGFVSYGKLIGSESDEEPYVNSFHIEQNYRFNKYFAVGLITGTDWFDVTLLPVGADIKLIHQLKKTAFYAGGSVGHSFPLENMELESINVHDTKGGPFVNAHLGYMLSSGRKIDFYVAVGYRYQSFSFIREDLLLTEVERKIIYNRFSAKIGVNLF
jgi:hypothetical protein